MNSKLLFMVGCIPTRLLLALLTYKISEKYLPYLSILFFSIGISFIYLYLTNSRQKAPEAGGKTWWNNIRPIHGMFYIIAGIYALKKSRLAALILVVDLIFGLAAFIQHRY
jgi:phosphatidylglycerophosphate synthase